MLVDLVKIISNTVGTGAITLGEAVPGFRGAEALVNGGTYSYSIQQEAAWELGTATLVGRQLVRSPIYSSEGGVAINLQPNAAIAFVALAEDIASSGTNGLILPDNRANKLLGFDGNKNGVAIAYPVDDSDGNATDRASSQRILNQKFLTVPTLAKNNAFVGPFALTSLGSASPANGVFLASGGNAISFQTRLSSPSGGADTDNQRASLLVAATTCDDGNSEEQTLCLLTTVQTGYAPAWVTSTAYAAGANVTANGNLYRCTTAGTSASSGTGPSGKGAAVSDGSVVWQWINDAAIDAKVGLYNEVQILPGAGHSWAQAHNFQIEAGVQSDFLVNTELDLTNNSGFDSTFGGKNRYGLYLIAQGASMSTAGIEVTTTNTGKTALLWGLHLSGDKLASQSVIGVDASAPVGLGFGQAAGGAVTPTFSDAAIVDGSTSQKGIRLAGIKSVSAVEISATAPAALSLIGTFQSWFIFTPGPYKVTKDGDVYANSYRSALGNTPATSSSAGTPGDIRYDTNFVYVCVAANTWKRSPLNSY